MKDALNEDVAATPKRVPPVLAPRAERPPPRRRSRLPLLIAVLAVLILGAIWWSTHRQPAGGAGGGRPGAAGRGGGFGPNAMVLPVSVAAAQKGDIHVYLDALGTVTPAHIVTIRTQISGQLMRIAYQEGQMVHQGDLIAQIDPRPYQVALEQAEGQHAQAQSQLRTAQLDLERYQTLAKEDSIAQQQVDTAQSQVRQFEGLIQTSQGAIDAAKLNLTYCNIVSPIDGRVGLRQVDPGNYVTPGDANGLVVITQTKPITVVFTLPEDTISTVAARLRSGAALPVELYDRTQANKLATGQLQTIDNQIDPTTGTYKLRAEFPNEDESLFPNQFVNVRLLVNVIHGVIVVPASAIERGQQGAFVYMIQPDQTAVTRAVTLGATEGDRVEVTSGLAVGEQVVTDGADRLREGMKVVVHRAGEPTADAGGAGGDKGPSGIRPNADGTGQWQGRGQGQTQGGQRRGGRRPATSGGGGNQ